MSDTAFAGRSPALSGHGAAAACVTWRVPGTRRALQLALAGIWLLDAVLQYQSWMFTRAFGQMLADSAAGNPGFIARPITWSSGIIEHHPVSTNTAFATIQLLLALGIAWRPALKAALAASVVWSVAVWWLGEGLGGILNAAASPVGGAPGAVIIYGLLAILLWPSDRRPEAAFTAARAVGATAARAAWLVLWASLAYFSLLPGNRAPQALHDMVAGMADGEPGWLAGLDNGAARLLAHQGPAASIVLAVVFALIALAVFAPAPVLRAAVVAAVVVAAVIWLFGQDLGEMFTGSATDPNSGPLLALLALAYWPARGGRGRPRWRKPRRRSRLSGPSRKDSNMNMGGPAWLADLVAVVTLVIAVYCLSRLVAGRVRARPTDGDVDATHALMGVGMAAMLVPSLSPVPAVTWSWVFAVVAIWLAWRIARVHRQGPAARIAQAHYVPHLVMSVAMIYMGAVAPGSTSGGRAAGGMPMGGPGAATAGFPPLTLLLALLLFGYVVWLLDQLPGIPSVRAWRSAPQLALAPAGAPAVSGRPTPAIAVRSAAPVVRAALAAHAGAGAAGAAARAGAAPGPDAGVAAGRGVPLSPRLEAGCHIAMAVAMGYMLILMV